MNKNFVSFSLVNPFSLAILSSLLALALTLIRGIEATAIQDAAEYVNQAKLMKHGIDYMFLHPENFQRPLGLPALVAFTFLLTGSSSLLLIKIILAISHGISTYLVAKIAIEIGIPKPFWMLGSVCFILDPFLFFAATDVQTESLTTLIVVYWCYFYLTRTNLTKNLASQCIYFSLSGLFAVTLRPNLLFPFLIIAVLLYKKLLKAQLFTRAFLLPFTIFTLGIFIYNAFVSNLYKGFIFLSPIGGWQLPLTCRPEFIPQYLGLASAQENQRINAWFPSYFHSLVEQISNKNPGISIPDINRELYKVGVSTCISDPEQSFFVLVLKSLALWRPFVVFGAYSPTVFILSFLFWVPLTFFAISFLFAKDLGSTKSQLRKYFIVLSISFTVSLIMTPTQIRHRVAFAEPFYWIFAMHFLSQSETIKRHLLRFYQRFKNQSAREENL